MREMAVGNYVRNFVFVYVFFALINIELSTSLGNEKHVHEPIGSCRCFRTDGNDIDLTELENVTANVVGFLTTSAYDAVYFFHPCMDLNLNTNKNTECNDGCSLCVFEPDARYPEVVPSHSIKGSFHKLVNAKKVTFSSAGSEALMDFQLNDYTTHITLSCSATKNATTKLLRLGNASTHQFLTLTSPYSCIRNLTQDHHYLSGSAVFFIILVVIASAYFCCGMLVLRFVKGAQGTEMIPNYEFWASLSGRTKNLIMRLLGKESQESNSYEKI